MSGVIRLARRGDLAALVELERAAGAVFRSVGMAAVADDEPPRLAELIAHQQDARAWIAADEADRPVGYLLVRVVDGNAHIEQVSIHPGHAGRRIGAALIDTSAGWGRQHRLAALTLTTFAAVPWNAPYYRLLGFHVLTANQLGPGLRRIRNEEAARSLDRWPRVAMHRLARADPTARRPQRIVCATTDRLAT